MLGQYLHDCNFDKDGNIRAAVDSKGNVYVAEDEGRRLLRFKIVKG